MADIALCPGELTQSLGGLNCSVDWQIVPYVEPTDSTAIYAQLVALNEFDPVIFGLLITGYLAIFITGYSAGIVLKKLRQA